MKIDISEFLKGEVSTEGHLDPITALDYLHASLNDDDSKLVLAHLNNCSECRLKIDALSHSEPMGDRQSELPPLQAKRFVNRLMLKIFPQKRSVKFYSEIYFVGAVLCIGLSFLWPARFWQFLTISLLLVIRFAVLRLESKRFLKIEKTIDRPEGRYSGGVRSDGTHSRNH